MDDRRSGPPGFVARVVTGRFTAEDIEQAGAAHAALGLALAWLAGIGRTWQNPRVTLLQHLGLGSVAYVVVLSAFLWLLLLPLRPERWSLLKIVAFVGATSPLGFLYAIPVDRFLSLGGARRAHLAFLAVVSLWRVILYALFLFRYARLRNVRLVVGTLFPLAVIVFTLTALNLERAVFDFMSGINPHSGTPGDSAYAFLFLLSVLSFFAAPMLALLYVVAIAQSFMAKT